MNPTKDAPRLAYSPIGDDEARKLLDESQQLVDALSPTIGTNLKGFVKDIDATEDEDSFSQRLRVSLAAANATLAVCAERIAQDTLLAQLSAATLN